MAMPTHQDLNKYIPSYSRRSVHRLRIEPGNPLYPFSCETLDLRSKKPVEPGVFEIGSFDNRTWLIIDADGTEREVTEIQALLALGADKALLALDLGDAAVSLLSGDLINARQQWLRHRDGR